MEFPLLGFSITDVVQSERYYLLLKKNLEKLSGLSYSTNFTQKKLLYIVCKLNGYNFTQCVKSIDIKYSILDS
jgi:hypothetical protein